MSLLWLPPSISHPLVQESKVANNIPLMAVDLKATLGEEEVQLGL